MCHFVLLFPKGQILKFSKLRDFANNIFKVDENDGKFSKSVENAVGKGKIASHEQFLPIQCSHKISAVEKTHVFAVQVFGKNCGKNRHCS